MSRRSLVALAAVAVGIVGTGIGQAVAANPPQLDGEDLLSVASGSTDYSGCIPGTGGVVTFSVPSGVTFLGGP